MDTKELPARPNLEQYKKQAKDLMKACASGDPDGLWRMKRNNPRLAKLSHDAFRTIALRLADAQLAIAARVRFRRLAKLRQAPRRSDAREFLRLKI